VLAWLRTQLHLPLRLVARRTADGGLWYLSWSPDGDWDWVPPGVETWEIVRKERHRTRPSRCSFLAGDDGREVTAPILEGALAQMFKEDDSS
jgi:hypothetical protein